MNRTEPESSPTPDHPAEAHTVTKLLFRLRAGEKQVADELYTLVYLQLRQLAETAMRKERPDHTLQPTALVHEAYLRLVTGENKPTDRTTFLSYAARAMRNLLVDYARTRHRLRRPEGRPREELTPDLEQTADHQLDLVVVNEAFERLAQVHARPARCFEMAFFAGFSQEKIGEIEGLERRNVGKELRVARAWLTDYLRRGEEGEEDRNESRAAGG